ncbi:MetQ/NlpA family ABC transporter substrate-binding protein [Sulfurospirillum sp.]|uniref:MetQ/NlpA family ABC transporter substrate-binding protein n=1 Tax=Sulfurospirillum sp. TaxID=2053622 RepID=UPI002FDDDD70
MYKRLGAILVGALLAFSGCSGDKKVEEKAVAKEDKSAKTIIVGATPVPHAEILEVVKPLLAKEGYTLEIKVFNDYVIPNKVTDSGEIDANFFQHSPYLAEFNKNQGTKLVSVGNVHIEPMGIYSKKVKSLSELKDGDTVAIPNDATNGGRALDVLATAGLIKLNDVALKTKLDIVENPKNLKFTELEAAQLPRVIEDFTLAVINTNYALSAGLNPTTDALGLESANSPYANIIVVKAGNEASAKTQALIKAVKSEEVKKFITEKYKGAIVPAF